MAGQSEAGKELAAYGGEALFGTASDKAEAQANMPTSKAGWRSTAVRPMLCASCRPSAARRPYRAEADALFEELQALISPALAVSYLSNVVGFDVTNAPLDGPMPQPGVRAWAAPRSPLGIGHGGPRGLSVRGTYERILPSTGGNMVKGDPTHVADVMEDWYTSKACDGFVLSMPSRPRSLRDFVELVVPELQRRGLRPPEYRGATLRDNMGLARRWTRSWSLYDKRGIAQSEHQPTTYPEEHAAGVRLEDGQSRDMSHPSRRPLRGLLRVR